MSVYKHWNEAEFYGNLSDWLASFGFDWFCCLFGIISFPSFFIPCRLIDHKNVFFSFNLYFTDFVFFMYRISEGKLFFWCCLFFCLLPLVLVSHSALTQSLISFLITSTTSWSSLVVSFVICAICMMFFSQWDQGKFVHNTKNKRLQVTVVSKNVPALFGLS